MSRFEELIQELCPEGVEFFTVKELTKKKTIKTITPSIKIKRNDYQENGITPIISQELEYISGYCDFIDNNIPKNNYVCFGDHSEHIKFVDFAFVQGADGLKIMSLDEEKLMVKFFYYAISSFYVRHNNYERHFKYLNDTEIPVPPLEVQREIVRIMDSFTLLTAELTAELTARKKQYEYYRDTLLSNNSHEDSKKMLLSEFATIKNGKDYKHLLEGEYPVYGSGGVMTHVNQYCYDKPTVLIPRKGSLNNLFYVEEPFWNVDTIFYTEIDEEKVVPKYLYYLLQKEHIESLNTAGGVPSLTQTALNKVSLLIPPLEKQKKVVACLDNFDAICSDLNIGLSSEIDARTKQCEFYRDKLLTFKKDGENA